MEVVKEDEFIYATDAPETKNSINQIYISKNKANSIEKCFMPGPTFKSKSYEDKIIFSSAVEPSSYRIYPFASSLLQI